MGDDGGCWCCSWFPDVVRTHADLLIRRRWLRDHVGLRPCLFFERYFLSLLGLAIFELRLAIRCCSVIVNMALL